MKTLAAILLTLLLMCLPCALALSGSGYPAYDGAALPDNAFGASFGGESLLLSFDPDPEYSGRMDGALQLSFYAYDASGAYCLELYLMLPENPVVGEPAFASLYLYEGDGSGETLYFASEKDGAALPSGSSLKLDLEQVDVHADAISGRGALEATLFAYRDNLPTGEMLTLNDARFSFTLPLNADAQGGAAPAFTLPPDYAKV